MPSVPPRDWQLRVLDIVQAIGKIERYVDGMTFDGFRDDDRTVDAVVRNVIVIGEAANHIPEEARALAPEVPWAQMRDIRNVLVHAYYELRVAILWETAVSDLPPLVPLLSALLREDG